MRPRHARSLGQHEPAGVVLDTRGTRIRPAPDDDRSDDRDRLAVVAHQLGEDRLGDLDDRRGEIDQVATPTTAGLRRRVGVAGGAEATGDGDRALLEDRDRLGGLRIRPDVEECSGRAEPDAVVHPVAAGDQVEQRRAARWGGVRLRRRLWCRCNGRGTGAAGTAVARRSPAAPGWAVRRNPPARTTPLPTSVPPAGAVPANTTTASSPGTPCSTQVRDVAPESRGSDGASVSTSTAPITTTWRSCGHVTRANAGTSSAAPTTAAVTAACVDSASGAPRKASSRASGRDSSGDQSRAPERHASHPAPGASSTVVIAEASYCRPRHRQWGPVPCPTINFSSVFRGQRWPGIFRRSTSSVSRVNDGRSFESV